jgi:cbb3-type cytochrome oxidase subunit 3
MRAIATEYFAGSTLMDWPLLALVIFISVFALAVIRLARRGRAAFDDVARLPLEDDRHE